MQDYQVTLQNGDIVTVKANSMQEAIKKATETKIENIKKEEEIKK